VGLDVHKDTIAVAAAEAERGGEARSSDPGSARAYLIRSRRRRRLFVFRTLDVDDAFAVAVPAALHALADAAEALARLAREVASERPEAWDDALIPVAEAARLAATSVRIVRDAIRRGELTAFGRMRDRAVSVETPSDGRLCVPVVLVRRFARRGSVARGVVITANPGGSQ